MRPTTNNIKIQATLVTDQITAQPIIHFRTSGHPGYGYGYGYPEAPYDYAAPGYAAPAYAAPATAGTTVVIVTPAPAYTAPPVVL